MVISMSDLTFEDVKKEISALDKLSDLEAKKYADTGGYADVIARANNLKTTQLRKFFSAIRSMEKKADSWKSIEADFYLLKPQLANARGRDLIPEGFYEVMKKMMDKVDRGDDDEKIENFRVFVRFLESIVAYHKFYNPRS
ncbi:MAG: CRISPR-associated protein Csm2 [Methanothermobacter sp.]|jgi:CRISPR-associated protein Csm2|uniref:CRISPR system Cms protein Csm2 n=2 Tax=Methanothermobacter thermautotrophicus TaxID=145262 RepID=O27153_METTH|nr:unknown [Methanothermobacter thermautotrophicus str. Delta H]MDN5374335.1 CRISPR-associated protein Csm2 [Methanothermobacter sp.]